MKKNLKPILLSILIIPLFIFFFVVTYDVMRNLYGYKMWIELIFNLLMTIVSYITFPVLYVSFNGKTSKYQASKIAITNSIIICLLFIAVRTSLNIDNSYTFMPAIFYGTINYAYLKLPKNNNDSGDDE